jgi:hypothetical protein
LLIALTFSKLFVFPFSCLLSRVVTKVSTPASVESYLASANSLSKSALEN